MMHIKTVFVLATTVGSAMGRFLPDAPPATSLLRRQESATPTSSSLAGSTILSSETPIIQFRTAEDPWQCVTENITQYFVDVPKPTGNVLDGINDYAWDQGEECRKTADFFECRISDPKSWCDFTTAAPQSVLDSYSADYLPSVTSFWKERSETVEVLSTSCSVAWGRPHDAEREWLRIAIAHAECYFAAHPESTGTDNDIPASSTVPSISTPTPIQDGMVSNCDSFHLVEPLQDCWIIADLYGIEVAQFVEWNPAALSDCSGLWADHFACVGVVASTPATTTAAAASTTTTSAVHAISTPTPIQAGMVSNCKTFHFVEPMQDCWAISDLYGITIDQFATWNTGVGGATYCDGLWAEVYVCVGI